MGVFSFIETFFFISLAITFILILMLVNHFKQRLTVIENKYDNLYEIINSNLLNELNNFKSSVESGLIFRGHPQTCQPSEFIPMVREQHFVSKSMPEYIMKNIESINSQNDKIVVSDNEDDDETDNDSESDNSSVSILYTGEEYEDDNNDDNNDSDIIIDENVELNHSMNIDDSESKIKIVNMDIQESLHVDNINNDYDNIESDSANLEEITEVPELLTDDKQEIHVEKKSESIDIPMEIENETITESNKDIYSKMNVNELRKIVITKGLCSDASKLKRNDLMKLLEAI